MIPVISLLLCLATQANASVLRHRSAQPGDRSWQAAVQDINGMISIITVLPVLTGKPQVIKLVASRIIPGSWMIAGIGAGRVLAKLQIGLLLCGFGFFRNIVGDLSYPHDEYVNRFMPALEHIPTGTAERHSRGVYLNHNLAEVYMVEAWFQSRGGAARVVLRRNNLWRMLALFTGFSALYAGETYLAMRCAADNCATVFLVMQGISAATWLISTTVCQLRRGNGPETVSVNQTASTDYRCFEVPVLGDHVSSARISFHTESLKAFQMFGKSYENPVLKLAGLAMLFSGMIDMLSTVLIIGKSASAYSWIAAELVIIIFKVIFCVEPLREMEIKRITDQASDQSVRIIGDKLVKLPLTINLTEEWECVDVTTTHNTFRERASGRNFRSSYTGVRIGQAYTYGSGTRYLALDEKKKLTLSTQQPQDQGNEALQREFLAALAAVSIANKIPSREFVLAVQSTVNNIKGHMSDFWYQFGTADERHALLQARRGLVWRTTI